MRRPRKSRCAGSNPRTTVNVPVESNSTSSAVTSAVIRGAGVVDPLLVAATTSLDPIFMPDLASTVRSGSRNRRITRSGRLRLSSTSADTISGTRSAGIGLPSTLTVKALLTWASATSHPGHEVVDDGQEHGRAQPQA